MSETGRTETGKIESSMSETSPFPEFIRDFEQKLRYLFHERSSIDEVSVQRGLPPYLMREIMASNPLATYVPERYGGRGGSVHEALRLTAAVSYESLPLSLAFGINWALFLQPAAKYAQEHIKPGLFGDFLANRKMGGLMITEPEYGSDALHMRSSYREETDSYRLKGTKHWAGLTGWADYWLLTARREQGDGSLGRNIDYFICDVSDPQQNVVVEEYFENLGLYMLPYGRNRVDVRIPKEQKLEPESTSLRMMLDLLHRSRMEFPGMAMGFLERMLDEAVSHCMERHVGGRSLFSYDQVQRRLSRLQAAYTVCSAMCRNSAGKAGIEHDLSGIGLEANSVKTYVTDLMQSAAQSLLQLEGAKGYRLDHIAGRAVVDSRPFQIFEGSNDILYVQTGQAVSKKMERSGQKNLSAFLASHELTGRAVVAGEGTAADDAGAESVSFADTGSVHTARLRDLLDFELQQPLSQRKLTDLGRIISRVIAADMVVKLGEGGFNRALIDGCLSHLVRETAGLLSEYHAPAEERYIEGYGEDGSWFELGG